MADLSNTPETKVEIPEGLRRQLAEFRRQLWRTKIFEAFIAGLIGLVFSFLLVYGMDRFWQTPGWMRLVVLLVGTSFFALFAPFWLHRWVWRHRRENELARLISRKYPGLGDRLLGVIELQNQQGNTDSLSPRLRAAAMEAVAGEVGKRKLDDALPPPRHLKWALVALILVIAAAASFTLTPRAGVNAFQRWLMPLSDTERYTFTRLDNPPARLAVPFGEAFEVTLHLAENSEQRPATGSGRYGLQPETIGKRSGSSYSFAFPGQQEPGTIVFRIGDVRHLLRVEPVQRPVTESVTATVIAPDYLGIPPKTVDLHTGGLSAVEGSRVQITLSTNRSLASGRFGPTVANLDAAANGSQGRFEPLEGDLILSGNTAKSPELKIGTVPFEIPFSWKDGLGLAGASGFRVRIDAVRDGPPVSYLQGIDRQKVMLPEETVDFEVLAEDDFGIKQTGIEWTGEFTKPTDETPAKGEMKLAEGGAEERRLSRPVAFSPAAVGILPQKILLRAYTEDYFPGRGRVYSEPVVIYVLSRDEHAQLLKSQFDRSLAEFEDLARRELNQLEENERLEKLDGEQLQTEENRKRLEAQEQAESENTERMEKLTERMEELMKDSTRNGEIDKDTLKKMAEALKSMQELSQKDMPGVEKKLGEAGEESNTPDKAEKDMAEAVEEQKKVVEKMQEAVAKANDANRQFEAGTFVNRLKKAASEQEGIANVLIGAFSRILGVRSSDLDPSDARRLQEASKQQSATASDVRWIQEDLAHYFARTEETTFQKILVEMRDSQIDLGLDEVRGRLMKNHSFQATEGAKKWAEQLTAWAKELEGSMNSGQEGGGGGGGPPSEDEDFEFMLRVMKMIQDQQDLRARTRALEQLRRSVEIGKENAEP
jgi:hypothetical protein